MQASIFFGIWAGLLFPMSSEATEMPKPTPGGYAVAVSRATRTMPAWSAVVDALAEKHGARVLEYDGSSGVTGVLGGLREMFPKYVAFVVTPEEATREFVIAVHRMTRTLDEDPYTDVIWGIVTGYEPADALRIAKQRAPLAIKKGAAGTGIPLELFEEGVWYSEAQKGLGYRKTSKSPQPEKIAAPDDTTSSLVDVFNKFQTDFFLTSGHATERDWQIGFSYKNGQFRCRDGVVIGLDREKKEFPIRSTNPKIYLAAGNCLIGRIRDRDSMALAFQHSAGVNQMVGYVVSTFYGYAGWGVKDYFLGQPGRFPFSEAFYANNQALMHRLVRDHPLTANAEVSDYNIESRHGAKVLAALAAKLGQLEKRRIGQDHIGLIWDRDTLAFYGDPAWDARIQPGKQSQAWEQTHVSSGDRHTVTFRVNGDKDVGLSRPPFLFLPQRIDAASIVIESGKEHDPVITDNFVMLAGPPTLSAGVDYRIVFQARKAQTKADRYAPPERTSR